MTVDWWKKHRKAIRGAGGILCLLVGGLLTYLGSRGFAERHYIVDAAACRMDVIALERADLAPTRENGSVVLFHGLSANKVIMKYLGRSFAELGLRVFMPDAPGHGRSPGPFTPAQAESCSLSLLRGLAARGMIEPDRTIVAGHSMGGAIALRVAEKFRPAGVIAISAAPMATTHGIAAKNLLFNGVPTLGPRTLILVGQYELPGLKENARDLASSDARVRFTEVPHNTHVSVLFSRTVAIDVQAWAALTLGLPETTTLPSRANLLGCGLGLIGILVLAGPLIREMVGGQEEKWRVAPSSVRSGQASGPSELGVNEWRERTENSRNRREVSPTNDSSGSFSVAPPALSPTPATNPSGHALGYIVSRLRRSTHETLYPKKYERRGMARWRGVLEVIVLSLAVVYVLLFVNPLRILHLFEGDYLASFFMLVGAGLVLLHFRQAWAEWRVKISTLAGAAMAALLLHFLVTGWFELTATSAWLTLAKWERYPLFFVSAFLFLYGLELLAGGVEDARKRFETWILLVVFSWLGLAFGVLYLGSGEILVVLLCTFFALFFVLTGLGIHLVRKLSGSATAAAVFGAILLAGFCLVLFPVS